VFVLKDGDYEDFIYTPDAEVNVASLPGCTITLADVFAE
jgi:hypothetical protein